MENRVSYVYRKVAEVDSHIDRIETSLRLAASSKNLSLQGKIFRRAVSSCAIAALVVYSAYPLLVNADTVVMHPETCLGGWRNLSKAEGEPQADGYFYEENSAHLPSNIKADLYCGSFTGKVEEGTRPSSILLRIHWSSSRVAPEKQILETSTIEITGENFASSTSEILDAHASSTVLFTSVLQEDLPAEEEDSRKDEETEKNLQSEVVESQQVDQAVPTTENITPVSGETSNETETAERIPSESGPVSVFFDKLLVLFVPSVLAQETEEVSAESQTGKVEAQADIPPAEPQTVVSEDVSETQVAQSVLSEDTAPTEVVQQEEEVLVRGSQGTDVLSSSSEASGNLAEEEQDTDPAGGGGSFLELSYALDGASWVTFASISPSDIRRSDFELGLENPSWADLAEIQIRIHYQETFDATPEVYLDGMDLLIDYEKEDKADVPPEENASTDGIVSVKGIAPGIILIREKTGQTESLSLYSLTDNSKETLPIEEETSPRFPIGFKGGKMFLLTGDEKTLIVYDYATKSSTKLFVPFFDISKGERAEFFLEGFPWKVILGGNNFYFYSEETGEVFSDEDSGFVSVVESSHEDGILVNKRTLEQLDILKREDDGPLEEQ